MTEFNNYNLIVEELESTFSQLENNVYQGFGQLVTQAPRVFVAGKGRSGFIANSFAMRLNQLDKVSYVVGETTTPSISNNDLFIIISGSGSTEHLRLLAEKADSIGATIALITTKSNTKIGQLADLSVVLPAGTKHDAEGSMQPLGSLFEQSSLIFLDSVVLGLMSEDDIDETMMQQNHANLE
ncbi:6-phospho-3-hexuloisomerase (plasmid) [Staphylococcus pasteuri]|uniref:6-phospho-3-hexuloisomerase n=1 Tax=Staphylococcus pasteuri TaxID=45972 RepID=UPI0012B94603|nr:6-phospho-3-hexuloisomerase [Staphylococcus pasteuri]WAE42032.1 6-phospho-3-hexuloisomerase [Staphylococcus pasteuri]